MDRSASISSPDCRLENSLSITANYIIWSELLTTPTNELEQRYPGICAPITLFLDINMPKMTGWQFVEELDRRYDEIALNPTVVLMYSTSDDDTDKQKAKSYETVSNFIVKGESTPESLRKAILDNSA